MATGGAGLNRRLSGDWDCRSVVVAVHSCPRKRAEPANESWSPSTLERADGFLNVAAASPCAATAESASARSRGLTLGSE